MQKAPSVLVVDDDKISQSLISKLVSKLGYQVITAESGGSALAALESYPVSLIISDYSMPEMTGIELLKKVKQANPKVPFILITANSNLEVIREAWQAGAFDYFQKPVFVDRFNQTVRLALEYEDLSISRRKFAKLEQQQPDPELLKIAIIRELAMALEREALVEIVEEFEAVSRLELDQILQSSSIGNVERVRALAHKLAGTSVNLGLIKLAERMRAIEAQPEQPINDAAEFGELLEKSIHWLKQYLTKNFMSWLEKK